MQKERINELVCKGLSDAEVVERALIQVDFFYCLYIRFEHSLRRYIRRISNCNEADAEDILQDAFIKVWRNLNAYQPDIKLSSWLYRIVHNETVSHWRKLKTASKLISHTDKLIEFSIDEEDSSSDYQEEKNASTLATLEKLPLKYKEVLVLKFLESMTYEEISDILKIPEGTVAIRINRAKTKFRKLSKEPLEEVFNPPRKFSGQNVKL
jgi:RNA polymerase sigma-70 factor (ECF subfamily)